MRIYRVSFVLLCDVSFISAVEPQFLLYVEPYMLARFLPKLVVVNTRQKGVGGTCSAISQLGQRNVNSVIT